ncbi:hypothetical protein MJG53_010652 [Ovis ammon polii x Ovis aries]|uniref:Uncharacterized protein n=1 Tax=Ovis ammon polii x Ovis aries TaxID=2918886 RepID=A0ACB9UV08_9CETA|nr:hypothetical protein MJG53_010652 [Ovis ammon polii x Ovis aries]
MTTVGEGGSQYCGHLSTQRDRSQAPRLLVSSHLYLRVPVHGRSVWPEPSVYLSCSLMLFGSLKLCPLLLRSIITSGFSFDVCMGKSVLSRNLFSSVTKKVRPAELNVETQRDVDIDIDICIRVKITPWIKWIVNNFIPQITNEKKYGMTPTLEVAAYQASAHPYTSSPLLSSFYLRFQDPSYLVVFDVDCIVDIFGGFYCEFCGGKFGYLAFT